MSIHFTEELTKKLLLAEDAEAVAAVIKAGGQDISAEDAAQLFDQISERKTSDGKELSLDELNTVSGGADRDFFREGCSATVEYGSDCWFSADYCSMVSTTYDNPPTQFRCLKCGGVLVWDDSYTTKFVTSDGTILKRGLGMTCAACGQKHGHYSDTDIQMVPS